MICFFQLYYGGNIIRINKRNGSTLIELIVVVAIIAVLFIVALPKYNSLQQSNQLNVSALTVSDVIDKTRQYSLSPRSDSAKEIAGYCYNFTEGAASQWSVGELYFLPENKNNICADATIIERGELPENIWLKCQNCSVAFVANSSSGNDINQGYPLVDGDINYNLQNTKTGAQKTVTLRENGVVDVSR